jgi:ABC-type Co2+ transport system permease subunit
MTVSIDEILKRVIKYLIEGFVVALAAALFPKNKKLNVEEIFFIGLTAAAVFALLDTFVPSVGASARQGAGFGIGANLVGFPR